MTSVSGLNAEQRAAARRRAQRAALLMLDKGRSRMRYTQGPLRWDGIAKGRFASRGDFPRYGDCSSTSTWCLYQALRPGVLGQKAPGDVVNGTGWTAGYTGTLLSHGKRVVHLSNVAVGDLVLYGRKGSTGAHVAIVVDVRGGKPWVVSFGSDPGPFLLPFDYRSDVMETRRYI